MNDSEKTTAPFHFDEEVPDIDVCKGVDLGDRSRERRKQIRPSAAGIAYQLTLCRLAPLSPGLLSRFLPRAPGDAGNGFAAAQTRWTLQYDVAKAGAAASRSGNRKTDRSRGMCDRIGLVDALALQRGYQYL